MKKFLILQTDFGLGDGAVSAMNGVALGVDNELVISNLTHEITPYNIWEASYRLVQTIKYWQEGSVFVSVVDPGVGSERSSIVVKTKSNHYIVTPNNGTITHVLNKIGIDSVYEIDETINRLPYSGESYTFHGRDIYAYTGARLAAGVIDFNIGVGKKFPIEKLELLDINEVKIKNNIIFGNVDIHDIRFGNLWTNISRELILELNINYGDFIDVSISLGNKNIYQSEIKFVKSFAEVNVGKALLYINSLDNIGIAINQGSFANAHQIGTGSNWVVKLSKVN